MLGIHPYLESLLRDEIPYLCLGPDGMLKATATRPQALLCGSFNPLHAGHLLLLKVAERKLALPVEFELALRNADKDSIGVGETERRLGQFHGHRPVWLTAKPKFVEKARLFPATIFVMGADTAERIVQPRFYRGEVRCRDDALAELRDKGCWFLVAGRIDSNGKFQGLESIEIPSQFSELFIPISEAECRLDLSSTVLRRSGPDDQVSHR